MQTNREDVGNRFMEIKIPIPKSKERSLAISRPYKKYYDSLANLKKLFEEEKGELCKVYK